MPESTQEIENRLENAVNTYRRDEKQKISKIAREFNVPYQRLRSRLHGHSCRLNLRPVNRTLDNSQEQALKDWIIHLDNTHFAPTKQQIQNCANAILARSHTDPTQPTPIVSKMWTYRFMRRLPPEFQRRKQKPIDPKRFDSEDFSNVVNWYERLQGLIKRYQLQPKDIYNFDEIGFLEGQGRMQAVVTRNSRRNENLPSSFSRNSLTIIECVSADGSVLPPCVIFKAKELMEDWFTHTEMPPSWIVTKSPSGFITDDIAYRWIKHFDHYSEKRRAGRWRLLLMDNHGSHLTHEFIEWCEQHKILLCSFPPHTTHFLQPLDGKPFQQYKHYHGEAVSNAARNLYTSFGKVELLQELPKIRQKTFKAQTILSGFKDRGIMPINPDPIIQCLESKLPEESELQIWTGDKKADGNTPTPPPTPSSASSSPKTLDKLRHYIHKTQEAMAALNEANQTMSPSVIRNIGKIFSGSLTQAESGAQYKDDLTQLRQSASRQNKPRSRRQVQSLSDEGIIDVRQAKRCIQDRKENEEAKEARRATKRSRNISTTQAAMGEIEVPDENTVPREGLGVLEYLIG